MNPFHPSFAIIIFLIAFFTGYIIKRNYKIDFSPTHFESIDGMRGLLALGVFIHHSCIWYNYIQEGKWDGPPSNLYNQLGQTSVALFFMITSFLFISKLLNSEKKEFNWNTFFIARIFRLVPMYYISLLLVIFLIMASSHWKLNVSPLKFLVSIVKWGSFTILGGPPINATTYPVNAGVVWSLPYEWLFYFSLPLFSLFILKTKPPIIYIFFGICFMIYFYFHNIKYLGENLYNIYSFAGGCIAPFLLKYTSISDRIKTTYSIYTNIIILIFLFIIGYFSTTHNIFCLILISVIFTLIALGGSLFGLLKNPVLKFLGEISYSTYLLHGIILFIVFHFGFQNPKQLSSTAFCIVVFLITPIVVVASFLGFIIVEKYFMNKSKIIIQKIKNNGNDTL